MKHRAQDEDLHDTLVRGEPVYTMYTIAIMLILCMGALWFILEDREQIKQEVRKEILETTAFTIGVSE